MITIACRVSYSRAMHYCKVKYKLELCQSFYIRLFFDYYSILIRLKSKRERIDME